MNVLRAPDRVAVGDLDGDGVAEIFVLSPQSNALAVFAASPEGMLVPRLSVTLGRTLIDIAILDVDDDGNNDVLVADAQGNRDGELLVLRGSGELNLAAPESFAFSVFALRSLATGDFDGDGFPDAAVVTGTRRQVALMSNREAGAAFVRAPVLAGFERDPRIARAARLDETGRDSLLVLNSKAGGVEELVVLQVDGETFTLPGLPLRLGASTPLDFVTGDFDGDGHTDIAVLHAQADRSFFVTTIRNRPQFSAGGATAPGSFEVGEPLVFDCPADDGGTLTRCLPAGLAAGDFDNDGRLDLAVSLNRPAEILVLNGIGDGSFDLAARIGLINAQTMGVLAAGDVTGDGVDDLIAADTGNNTITVLRADAPPLFGLGAPCLASRQCASGACVDGNCCASATCPIGERCDMVGQEGTCQPLASLGTPCGSGATCASGFCTSGVCCRSATCPTGQTCAAPGAAGQCTSGPPPPTPTPTPVPGSTPIPQPLGSRCATGSQCLSGLCVDGFCCEQVCAEGSFCNISGSEGSCTPRRFVGEPCGNDFDCLTLQCGENNLCRIPVSPTPTPIRLPIGAACTNGGACTSGYCTNDVCCQEPACGVGERCDVFGTEGDCRPQLAPGAACLRDSDCRNNGTCSPAPTAGDLVCVEAVATPRPSGCFGDCGGDGRVTVDEVLVLIEIALGTRDVTACSSGDIDGDGQVSVDEVLSAVGLALVGCPDDASS